MNFPEDLKSIKAFLISSLVAAPAPVVPKDDFKQKPQKPFSLDAPKPKEIAPATDTTTIKPK